MGRNGNKHSELITFSLFYYILQVSLLLRLFTSIVPVWWRYYVMVTDCVCLSAQLCMH